MRTFALASCNPTLSRRRSRASLERSVGMSRGTTTDCRLQTRSGRGAWRSAGAPITLNVDSNPDFTVSRVAKGDFDPHRRGCRRGILPDLEGLRHRPPAGTHSLALARRPRTSTAGRSHEHRGRRRVRRAGRRSRRTTARPAVDSPVGSAHVGAWSRRGRRWHGLDRVARPPSTLG